MIENNVTRINRITFDVVLDNDDEKQVVYEIEGADKATIALINDYNYHPKFGRVPNSKGDS